MDRVEDVVEALEQDRVAWRVGTLQEDEEGVIHEEQNEERQIHHVCRYTTVLQQDTTPKYVHTLTSHRYSCH